MREIRHENLVPFLGACVVPGGGGGDADCDGRANGLDGGGLYVVMPSCSRGGLDDVLSNDNYRLDNMFAASLVADLAKGMEYLHNTAGVAHGNLRSSNCLVDTRWVLQISGFGLRKLRGECSTFKQTYSA